MFRNRAGALFFVVVTAMSAAVLIGGEGDQGVLLGAAEELAQQKAAMEAAADDLSDGPTIPADVENAFTADEDLIDEATGFDPTPVEEGAPPASEVVPHDEVVIVSRDAGDTGQ